MKNDYRKFLSTIIATNLAINLPLGDGEGEGEGGGEGSGGGEGEGGGEGSGVDITKTEEFQNALKAASDKILNDETSRLKDKNKELLEKVSDGKKKLEQFDGLDVEKVRVMLDQVAQSEEAKLISEGQLDEVIKLRVDKERGAYEDSINELQSNQKTLVEQRDHYKIKYEENVIGDKLRKSAAAAGAIPQAMEDILFRGKSVFSVSQSGEVEARDKNGELLRANDNQLMTCDRFVESLKRDYPHYWPASSGTGAKGSGIRLSEKDSMSKITDIASTTGADGQIDMKEYRKARQGMSGENYNK